MEFAQTVQGKPARVSPVKVAHANNSEHLWTFPPGLLKTPPGLGAHEVFSEDVNGDLL